MNKKIAPRVQLNFAPEESDNISSLEQEEPIIDEEINNLPCEMPEVMENEEIVENDIFDLKMKEKIEPVIIDELPAEEAPLSAKPKKQPQQKQTKKKRQLSEEHKAKLALAREKALVTRRKNAEEKKKMKQIEKQTKELRKKKAQKDLEQLEDEVIHDKPVKSTPVSHGQTFTKEDLENASLEAIMKYEAIRKARKEEKKKQQMIDQQKKDLQKKIQGYGARDANGRLLNKWDRCY